MAFGNGRTMTKPPMADMRRLIFVTGKNVSLYSVSLLRQPPPVNFIFNRLEPIQPQDDQGDQLFKVINSAHVYLGEDHLRASVKSTYAREFAI